MQQKIQDENLTDGQIQITQLQGPIIPIKQKINEIIRFEDVLYDELDEPKTINELKETLKPYENLPGLFENASFEIRIKSVLLTFKCTKDIIHIEETDEWKKKIENTDNNFFTYAQFDKPTLEIKDADNLYNLIRGKYKFFYK